MGYEAATFQEIATRADLTRPAINHYYPSKQALYRQVVAETNEVVIAAAIRQAGDENTLAGRVGAFVQASVHTHEYDGSAAAFLVTSVLDCQRHPELEQEHSSLHHTREFAASAVRAGIEDGELRADLDADVATEMLVAALWGLGFYAGFVGDRQKLTAVTAQFVGLLGGDGWKPTG